MIKHVLKKNDTLEGLSVAYELPVCMIARANGGFKCGLKAGEEVSIPPRDFCLRVKGEYIVAEGEALPDISRKTSCTMREILSLNGIAPSDIQAGERIFLPQKRRIYNVGCAETLKDISQKMGIAQEVIGKYNDVAGGIYRGMQLILPRD